MKNRNSQPTPKPTDSEQGKKVEFKGNSNYNPTLLAKKPITTLTPTEIKNYSLARGM